MIPSEPRPKWSVRRRRFVAALAAGLIPLMAASACGVPADDRFRPANPSELPLGLGDPVPQSTTTIPTDADLVAIVFPSRTGMVQVARVLPRPVVFSDVIRSLALGPQPQDPPGLRTVVQASLVRSTLLDSGVATVALDPTVRQMSAGDQQALVAQLVLTLTARPGVGQVRFTIDGAAVDVPRADGSLVSGAVSREVYLPLMVS